jgi:hypothetical protein
MNHHRLFKQGPAVFLLLAFLLGSTAGAANLPLPAAESTSTITGLDLKKHLSFLASDELGGRFTLSPSSRVAARYLASQLESYGYRGAARDGSFFQKVPLSYRNIDVPNSHVSVDSSGSKQRFAYATGFAVETPEDLSFSGDLVFVSYGIASPVNHHNDYAGLNVRNKIVVAIEGVPESLRGLRLSGDEQVEEAARARGASGIIKIPEAQVLTTWSEVMSFLSSQQQLGLPPRRSRSASGKVLPLVVAGPDLIKALARAMGKESADLTSQAVRHLRPMAIPATAEVRLRVDVKEAPLAQNVVGILEGSDPRLKDEYVVFSAHYDHLKTSDNGEIYNGADDDGSGTVSVLEIAQAFSVGPRPKRSILVIFHTAEELGLFGSEFNTDYEPVVPLEKLVANFNIDMIGRSRPEGDTDVRNRSLTDKDSLYVIGADKLSTELNQLNEQTNLDTVRLRFDYTYNDEKHPERFYYRSDHYNYAKHGIPVIFYFTGVHRDYHRTTDDVEKIDFGKMERIARMIFATGWRVANLDHRIVVDKKH